VLVRDVRRYAPALILALGALLVSGRREQQAPAPRLPLASLPESLGTFHGRDVTISEEEQRVAGMSEYMLRQYTRDSTSTFSVYVGYYAYQLQGRTIHSPKNCLPGAGWQALGTGTESITVGDVSHPVNRYLLTNGTERALVYYWYQGRGRIAASEFGVKWDLLRDAALRGRSEEALVRIVVPLGASVAVAAGDTGPGQSRASDVAIADQLAADVAARLIPRVTDVLPHWEFGRGTTVATSAGEALQ
jgi:EpsI family protein